MTKKRTPTICEWALGFTVEDYLDQKDRRRQRRHGKTSNPRFKVEVSTDEESEENSLKITYPRSGSNESIASGSSSAASSIKKVRFEKMPPKSAIRKSASDSETVTDNETKKSSDSTKSSSAAKSSDSSKPSSNSSDTKNKENKSGSDSSNADTSSGDSEPQSDCYCCRRVRRKGELRGTGHGKKEKSRSKPSETESSGSEVDELKPRVKSKNGDKSGKRSKKADESEAETDNEASSSEDEAPKNKTKDRSEDKSKRKKDGQAKDDTKGKKSKHKEAEQETVDSNVGPSKKKGDKKSPDKDSNNKKTSAELKKRKSQLVGKTQPDGNLSPHIRRPNLIMPITAQVLQIEHAIEGVEDPRPNAFHDGQHGVLRVYHGPAYGNPTGMLYPRRDLSSSSKSLPLGTPHPMDNPYFHGFASPANPGDLQVQCQSPWSASIPITSMPDGPPMRATSGPPQTYAPWPQNVAAGPENKTYPQKGSPIMSGALNPDASAWNSGDNNNKGSPPRMGSQLPINVNMYSCGGSGGIGDPWSEEGRQRYRDLMNKARQNNNRHQDNGSNQGSKNSGGKQKVPRDLQWDPLPGETAPVTASWVQDNNQSGWGTGGSGNNDWTNNNNNQNASNGRQNNAWGQSNGTGGWSATWEAGSNGSKKSNKANGGDSSLNILPDMGSNNGSNKGSNSSKGSKNSQRSQRSNKGPTGDNVTWGGEGNNVGFSSGNSNHSGGSKNGANDNGPPPGTDWDNNAVPANPTNTSGNDTWGTGGWNRTSSWTHNGNGNGGSDPSTNMPGAWGPDTNAPGGGENANFLQTQPADTGGFCWGDTSAAQVPNKTVW